MNAIQQIKCKLIRVDGSEAGNGVQFMGAPQSDILELGKYQAPLTDFLVDLFMDRGCCSLGFLKSQLNGHICDDFSKHKQFFYLKKHNVLIVC